MSHRNPEHCISVIEQSNLHVSDELFSTEQGSMNPQPLGSFSQFIEAPYFLKGWRGIKSVVIIFPFINQMSPDTGPRLHNISKSGVLQVRPTPQFEIRWHQDNDSTAYNFSHVEECLE